MDHLDPYAYYSLVLTISAWDSKQVVNVDSRVIIGNITIFDQQTGKSIKISDLQGYALFRPLITTSTNNNNSNTSSSSTINHGGVVSKKEIRLSNDQTIQTYSIKSGTQLELRQVDMQANNNNNNYHHPRWYYKTIVPSNQLESLLLLKDNNNNNNNNTPATTSPSSVLSSPTPSPSTSSSHFSNSNCIGGHALLGGEDQSTTPVSNSWQAPSTRGVIDIIDNIKSNKLVTIESPKKPSSALAWQQQQQTKLRHSSSSSSPSPLTTSPHNKRVLDVIECIESQLPMIKMLDNVSPSVDDADRWEARINSSDDLSTKRLAMDDSLGQEAVKQEYIEFSLRFEQRTSLLLGVSNFLSVWIEPIQSFFTLCFSRNATVHDAIYFVVQYIYPTCRRVQSSGEGASLITSNDPQQESFVNMVDGFGLYLQESDTMLLPLQHKQLLTSCKVNNHNSGNSRNIESVFIFKAKKQQQQQRPRARKQLSTSGIFSLDEDELVSPSEQEHCQDEGYNLTVLFPSHQTYRQFHFNPNRTVNQIIQSIVSATSTHNQQQQPPDLMRSGSFDITSTSPTQTSSTPSNRLSRAMPPLTPEQSSISFFSERGHTIFESAHEAGHFCLYYQKCGSGVWMEGHRTLASYNLPNEAVVEFKPPPMVCKLALIEGCRNTIKLYHNMQTFIVVYGNYTKIADLKHLLAEHCQEEDADNNEQSNATFELFLVKSGVSISLSNVESFHHLDIETNDILEYKLSVSQTPIIKDILMDISGGKSPTLIPGEHIILKRNGDRLVMGQLKKGTLFLTNYRLIFNAYNRSSYDDFGTKDDCDIPIATIQRIKHISNSMQTEITCKDFRVCSFTTGDPVIWEGIKDYLESSDIDKVFAFANAESYDPSMDIAYNVEEEFIRQGFPPKEWRITYANKDYKLCPTYPSLFIVPQSVTDDDLRKIASFREKGRVPAICWIHKIHQSTISRCSQPRVGIFKSKCNEDEEYLKVITKSNTNSKILYVMDSRPMANAKANTLLGKGHEDTSLYQNVELQFLGIGNIHVMRDSYKKMYALIQANDSSNWLSLLDGTQWLEHIFQLINSANRVVELVDKKGASILTHCSDGWDRTSQLVALSQLLLDPYYRTLQGFQVLIEKEWLSYGHQFTHRCAHVYHSNGEEEFSPIFIMFVDSVWQLTNLFPTTFQFNESFLITLLEALYNCKYGTFLFNHQKERVYKTIRNGAIVSIWAYVNSNKEQFTNSFYIQDHKPIFHQFAQYDIQFWSNYYFRWRDNFRQRSVIDNALLARIEEIKKGNNNKPVL
ncbi:hypothetical protein SAMD00019534_097780 [Acytostelium subglobosum LB1]|uniref:hypothetical protein n=1 Tax=Acytostelium subglobosum LB1 TaxID=1410327 RepID=UPI000644D2CD|nr:hypothetical protein SAMD00019534_097780 [Acytostelium subglobosum LB1]GAM26603.1 hypothetical protein SAMD00019534_097780 [Acytostelium subglobosum LB1]|eukprot:XP_012750264.1 hypothetical protein SAMD00019534_097780 [Acytostelium subglobosum LB1]